MLAATGLHGGAVAGHDARAAKSLFFAQFRTENRYTLFLE